ncbi:MAG: GNAT family N-acetyltransferase [Candidatus Sumerlaeaceae bacterium]
MSKFVVREIENHERDTWDEFVMRSRQGTLFHTSGWCETLRRALAPAEPVILGCFEGSDLVGGCVFLERERFGMRTAVTPLLTPYSGFLSEPPLAEKLSDNVSREHAILEALCAYLLDSYTYLNLVLAPHLEDIRPLQQAGFNISPRFTYYLNMRLSAEEHWRRFDGSARRQIKKAERQQWELSSRLPLDLAYELFAGNFARRGESCPVSYELFIAAAEHRGPDRLREVFAVWHGERLAGFVVVLGYNRTLYYALAAHDAEYLSHGVSSFLVWEIIKRYSGVEWFTFDFVGANIPSIARFKENFNPRLQLYFQVEHYGSSFLKLGKGLLDRVRS